MDVLTCLEGICLLPDFWASQARRLQPDLTAVKMDRFSEGLGGVQPFLPGIEAEKLENSPEAPVLCQG